MGLTIGRDSFEQQEYTCFTRRVQENLSSLQALLNREGFGIGESSIGAELEMYLVGKEGRVSPINQQVIAELGNKQLQPELNRFNLEYNLNPVATAGQPFQVMAEAIDSAVTQLNRTAAAHGAQVVSIGILPTLRKDDLHADAMTDHPRYRALARGLLAMRNGPFRIEIEGIDPLSLQTETVTLEGANTSFQVHWRVNPDDFADSFNAVQLLTPLALAIGANSPTLLGHRLWDETRIALFKQSIDYRSHFDHGWQLPSRIPFGFGWVRSSALELFAQSAALFPPLLPICGDEQSEAVIAQGGIPKLDELRLHHGTVWSWNRAVYDDADGGHLRIEMRALPAGPSSRDMVANAALLIGAAQTVKHQIARLLPALPYRYAEYNFYRAAKFGLNAKLIWPTPDQTTLVEKPVDEIIEQILPMAAEGLSALGVADEEIKWALAPIDDRLRSGITGADWQRRMFDRLSRDSGRDQACHGLLQAYIREQQSGRNVANWSDTP